MLRLTFSTMQAAGAIGQMFSGFLQAGAYNGLNGVQGMAGWRCTFVIVQWNMSTKE